MGYRLIMNARFLWACLGLAAIAYAGPPVSPLYEKGPITPKFASTTTGGNMAITLGAYDPSTFSGSSTNKFNTGFGIGVFEALPSNVSGTANNTAFGYDALLSGTSISGESAFGKFSLRDDVEGNFNAAFGQASMRCFTGTGTKSGNVAVGHGALAGDDALCASTVGGSPGTYSGVTAVGAWAMQELTTAVFNVAVGDSAGLNLTTGGSNVIVGAYAGCADTTLATAGRDCATMANSVGVGFHALRYNQSPSIVGVGYEALGANTTGVQNAALGFQAMAAATTDTTSTAVGYDALLTVNGGVANTAVGANAGKLLPGGSFNTYFGANAGATQAAANSTTAVGAAALTAFTGSGGGGNTAVGDHAGATITSGIANTILGSNVGGSTCTTATGNILIGVSSYTTCAASNTSNTLQITGLSPGTSTISATGINGATPVVTIGGDFTVNFGTGNTRVGASDAAVPVDQIVSVQGARSGTDTNTAGANIAIRSGMGTGNVAGSTITLAPALAVASGTGAQTPLAQVVVSTTALTFGSVNNPTFTFSGSGAISGTPVTNLFASAPAIGSSTPAAGAFTTLSASSGFTGVTDASAGAAGKVGEVVSINCPVNTQAAAATSVTITIASPGVVTWSSHTFVPSTSLANYTCAINFLGTPPTGIVVGTNYYIIGSTVSGDTFQVADTAAHALAGTNAVNTTGSDGGTTARLGNLAGTTTAYNSAALAVVAGDWDCSGVGEFQELTTLTMQRYATGLASVGGALGAIGTYLDNHVVSGAVGAFNNYWPTPVFQYNVSSASNLFLITTANWTVGTMVQGGLIRCRRMR